VPHNPGMATSFPSEWVRSCFPGLQREVAGRPVVFFDGPAGSQVPRVVVDAVSDYLVHCNANCGGAFATSVETDGILDDARGAMVDFLGAPSPEEVVFGPNMTTLTLALSEALARVWGPGDEVVVTRLDHDANVTPWEIAARDAGARVRHVGIDAADGTLNFAQLCSALCARTRLVAVSAASNLIGTVQPIAEIAAWAHDVGAQLFVDAVHYAPHRLVDVDAWQCDYLACSPYKFFGPHVGVLWGRAELLRELPVRKLRVSPDSIPERWMVGTQNHEGIAGAAAAVGYLAELGRRITGSDAPRRELLAAAYSAIQAHEQSLAARLIDGLSALPGTRVWGVTAPDRVAERVPTVAFTHARERPHDLARFLAENGIFVWSGNNYALPLTEALDLEPDGAVRVGVLHYNTSEEVERLVTTLAEHLGR